MSKDKSLYLVAVDGSEWSDRAAAFAVEKASKENARIIFITVIPWSGFQPLTMDEIAYRPIDKGIEEDLAKKNVLDPLYDKYKDTKIDISTEYHWGNPSEVIHDRAKKLKAAQVFVGRRGRSKISDLILGSVANTLAHTLGVPITLVP
ncbi:universal stress protein [Kordiimonas pumila]|uniref:Universal stress protein n=1 Tax=Kordiimonas pumila TaxID=2161677 RepID=A0ABV7D713_9PROT|nr:universal stress protein [Kordiimonas pumila]